MFFLYKGFYLKRVINSVQDFFKLEQATGIVLILSVILALIFANTGLKDLYYNISHGSFSFELAGISIKDETFHYFVNDGLMAIFFFLIGLEVKREFVKGELSDPKNVILPAFAAFGGLIVPIIIYTLFNLGTDTIDGWAISGATDIAIAFGVLALMTTRIPSSLKVFLMMLAIFDDLMVIAIISVFFTETLNFNYIFYSLLCTIVLFFMNKKYISNFAPFAIIGFLLWYFVLKSGIHATVAGIILAIFIPTNELLIYDENNNVNRKDPSMLDSLEHSLHEFVSFFVLPIFAFINAGVVLSYEGFSNLSNELSLGIILGLFIGKQLGVFGFSYVLIKMKVVTIPKDSNLGQLYGVAILCGIGFTMGLFIGELAFKGQDVAFKLPVLIGSLISALFGLFILHISSPKKQTK